MNKGYSQPRNNGADLLDFNDVIYVLERNNSPIVASIAAPVTVFEGGTNAGEDQINPTVSTFLHEDGKITSVFHIKPIYYLHQNGGWRPMSEIASYFGNRKIVLRDDWDQKVDLRYLSWLIKRMEIMNGTIQIPSPMKGKFISLSPDTSSILFTTTNFYPDPSVATNACDGTTEANQGGRTFAFQRADTGGSNVSYSISPLGGGDQGANACVNNWGGGVGENSIQRGIFMFYTAAIGSGSTVSAATFSLYGNSHSNANSTYVCVVATTPAGTTTLVNADFALGTSFGATKQNSSDLSLSTWSDAAYNDFTFNSTGYGNVSKTGVSKYGTRIGLDFDNSAPGSPNQFNQIVVIGANNTGTTQDPKLAVTYSLPFAPLHNLFVVQAAKRASFF